MAQAAKIRINEVARDAIRAEVRACKGNEVFFQGRLKDGIVISVEA